MHLHIKHIILGLLSLCTIEVFGQKVELLKDIQFDSSYSIIGLSTDANARKISHGKYDFLITTLPEMFLLKKEWVFDQADEPMGDENELEIYIIQNKEIVAEGGVGLETKNFRFNGEYYPFDMNKLNSLHKKHPLTFHQKMLSFVTKEKYKTI